jgi:hypothetical protein
MSALARFQHAFAAALVAPAEHASPESPASSATPAATTAPVAALVAQPGFAVYRNTVASACIDALQANYPTVSRLVGNDWFRAAARIYLGANPPRQPAMLELGEDFAGFLAAFEPAADLPYLEGVARLDRLWTRAHVAADAPALAPARVAALAPALVATARLGVHPAARWAQFDDVPVATIWRRHRDAGPDAEVDLDDLAWRGDGVLLTRPEDAVQWIAIEPGAAAFLSACARGEPLAQAATAALDAQPGADLATMMAQLLDAGAFAQLQLSDQNEEQFA